MVKPVLVAGAGPAGLCAAIELKKRGAPVILCDENDRPGGQLFKQIHKFFGSREHQAGIRGFDIGKKLLEESLRLGIDVRLGTEVVGINNDMHVWVSSNKNETSEKKTSVMEASLVILAAGAKENALSFPGWTLPGVMTAGCAQTMINVHRVLPGKRVLMVGSGNVGVIVAYQLMQAGAEVAAIVEAAPALGAYGVHTAKVARAGVPFFTQATITRACGAESIEKAYIASLDTAFSVIPGTEREIDVDTICLAVGLTPSYELLSLIGCETIFVPELGGVIPVHDRYMRSSNPLVYVVGDSSGVEEASTAMEEGRLAGIHAAWALGFISEKDMEDGTCEAIKRLEALRHGIFGQKRFNAKARIIEASHKNGKVQKA